MFKRVLALLLTVALSLSGLPTYANESYGATQNDYANHWAQDEIAKWNALGIIQGYKDGLIRPDAYMSRGEFATVINRVFGFTEKSTTAFSDIKAKTPYAAEILVAVAAGYLEGYPDHTVKPSDLILRQEAATMLARVFQLKSSGSATLATLEDESNISDYAKEAILSMLSEGYMVGYPDGTFKPEGYITRAEVIKVLDNILPELYNTTGNYTNEVVNGNVLINQSGVVLKNTVIEGDLYLAPGIGEGDITLDNVTVKGQTYVNGGGTNSVHIINSALGPVLIYKKGDPVRIVVTGTTVIASTTVLSSAKLEEEALTGDGFVSILLDKALSKDAVITLIGNFGDVEVKAEGIQLDAREAIGQFIVKADNVKINDTVIANGTNLNLNNSTDSQRTTTPEWSMVWHDEFDQTGDNLDTNGLDLNKWAYQLGTKAVNGPDNWGNNEQQYYRKENISVEDGRLIIEAKNDGYGGKPYTSGRLWTEPTFSQTYGKFEARIKSPEGQGYWPAFWLLPKSSPYGIWAATGEIDIMEARGRLINESSGAIHYGKAWPNNTFSGGTYSMPSEQDITGFHTYSLEWEPGEIRWYVDGNLFYKTSEWFSWGENQGDKYSYPAPFDQDFYVILNLAVGGTFDGNKVPDASKFPATMEVDYVRVYELKGGNYKPAMEPTIAKEAVPSNAKQPLNDGNFIYNNNFDQDVEGVTGITNVANTDYWTYSQAANNTGGNAVVSIDPINGENFAKLAITNGGSQSYSIQLLQEVPLVKGHFYKVSFDAKSDGNRTMLSQLGGDGDRNWAKYSAAYSFSLSTTLKTYQYAFQMKDSTDTEARLELNFGTNNRPVWIGNIRVEEVDSLLSIQNGPKEPLPNGNFIYNGTFDQGAVDRMTYWNFNSIGIASASVNASRELAVTIANGGSNPTDIQVSQKGLNFIQGNTYSLTFTGRATAARTITVGLKSKDGTTAYTTPQAVSLTTTNATYTVNFAMPSNASDTEGQLVFNLGGNTEDVYIDNVQLIRTTVDLTGVDLFPLKNGNFTLGFSYWDTLAIEGGGASFNSDSGQASIHVTNIADQPWKVMLSQGNMSFTANKEYILSFDASASVPRTIQAVLENGNYDRTFDSSAITVGPETKHFSYVFSPTSDQTLALKFLMANLGTTPTQAHDIVIDNVVLQINNPPLLKPGTIIADSTDNKVGQAIDQAFENITGYGEAIQSVKVNGVALTDQQYVVNSGNITISNSVFTTPGAYNITVEATGYADFSLTQDILSNDGNLVKNGDFSNGTQSFAGWFGNGGAYTAQVIEGVNNINILAKGPDNWSVQYFQENITLEAGKTYELSFRAWSDQNRPIQVEFSGYKGNENFKQDITNDNSIVYKYYPTVAASNTTFKLNFLIGNVTNGTLTTPGTAHTLYLDDIVLKEVTISEPPTLTADTTDNTVGQNVALTFDDNSAWRSAITSVRVDGVVTTDYVVTAGAISLAPSLFTTDKTYTIQVDATGYKYTRVSQVMNSVVPYVEVGPNLITDGTFDVTTDFTGVWKTHNQGVYEPYGGLAAFAVVSGQLEATIQQVGWEWWHIQLFQESIPVTAGTYKISFDITSDVARPITLELTGGAPSRVINVTSTPQTVEVIITVGADGSYKYIIGLGRAGADPILSVPYKITIDNVKLVKVTQ